MTGHRHDPAYDTLAGTWTRCTTWATCSPSPAGTRRPTCRPRATRRAPRRWPRWRRCCTACAPTRRCPSSCERAEQEPLDEAAARQPARDAPPLAPPTRCPSRWCSAGSWPRRAASTPGAAAPGQRLGRLPGELPRGAGAGARGGGAAVRADGLSQVRRADGPLRARHDLRQVDRVFGEVRQWLPGLIQQVRGKQAREPLIEPVGPLSRWPRSARCASR
jgi:carboxypeptidase Taq